MHRMSWCLTVFFLAVMSHGVTGWKALSRLAFGISFKPQIEIKMQTVSRQRLAMQRSPGGNPLRFSGLRMSGDTTNQWEDSDEDWQKWKASFAGKFVLKSGSATLTSREAAKTITADELIRTFGTAGADRDFSNEAEPLDILEIEHGRTLTQDESDFLDGKFKLGFEESGVPSAERNSLPLHVLDLLRDNKADLLEDLRWEDFDERGLVSRSDFKRVLMEGDAATNQMSLTLLEAALDSRDPGEHKQLALYFGSDQAAVCLSVPADPSSLLDSAMEVLDANGNPDEYIPYYVQLWPSAMALAAEFLLRPEVYRGKRVVEISAGMGLPGVAAALAGARRTMLTEYDAIATGCIEQNGVLNGVHVETSLLDWFRPTGSDLLLDVDAWDVVAFADVMYESRFVEPVAGLIGALLRQNRGCRVLFTDPRRASLPSFRSALQDHGLQVVEEVRLVHLHKAALGRPLDSDAHAIALLTVTLPDDEAA